MVVVFFFYPHLRDRLGFHGNAEHHWMKQNSNISGKFQGTSESTHLCIVEIKETKLQRNH